MGSYTTQFAKAGSQELTLEERNILSVAFKNVVGTRRAAWRVLSSIQKKENNKGNAENVNKVKHYKEQLETELTGLCQDILDLVEDYLMPNSPFPSLTKLKCFLFFNNISVTLLNLQTKNRKMQMLRKFCKNQKYAEALNTPRTPSQAHIH